MLSRSHARSSAPVHTSAPVQRAPTNSAGPRQTPIEDLACTTTASPVQLAALQQAVDAVHAQLRKNGPGGDDAAAADVHAHARRGIASGGGALPHAASIQRAFGAHDVSHVQAHVGGPAQEATRAMGAEAYATGDHVAFGGAPDLHTAAHEAAHVVQQRAGVQLAGGVGRVGDPYEQHADEVADAVVQGKNAESLLDKFSSRRGDNQGVQRAGPVQREGSGPHAQRPATATDQAAKAGLLLVSAVASAGLPNAAANLRHYLFNSGSARVIDIHTIFGSLPVFKQQIEGEMRDLALQKLKSAMASKGPVPFNSGRRSHYFDSDVSRDWYCAVGGCNYTLTGNVKYEQGRSRAVVVADITLNDLYNWDGGKSINLVAGLKITDEFMGSLHKAGIAREFAFTAKGQHSFAFQHNQAGPQRY